MIPVPMVPFHDGNAIPQVGLGVFQVPDGQAGEVVRAALSVGYRSVDTAAVYRNERGVGEGLRAAGLPAGDVFVTTKVWNDDQGFDATLAAFEASRARLGLDVIDLYLVHWPCPRADRYVDTWRALVALRDSGRVRSIGVSNFMPEHLDRIIDATGVVPALNQVELHPLLQQEQLRARHAELGIVTEAWSPLAQGRLLDHPVLVGLAAQHGVSVAQVILRWHLQQGTVVIPKSVTASRIESNIDLFGFELSVDDLAAIAALDADQRVGPDPRTFG